MKKFRNNKSGYSKKFPRTVNIGYRDEALIQICQSRRVAHIGCNDWPNQQDLMISGTLLHQKLLKVTTYLVGIDTDPLGIQMFNNEYPDQEFIVGDISDSKEVQEVIKARQIDIILIPDVIEHVEDAKKFLLAVGEAASKSGVEVVLTTPNAFSLKTFLPVFFNVDYTHPDHCNLHNEFTLKHLVESAGYQVNYTRYYQRNIKQRYGSFMNFVVTPLDILAKWIPHLGDGIIMSVKSSR